MSYNIIATPNFKKEFKHLAKKYSSLKGELEELISELENNPKEGVSLGNNCYKIRLRIASKGKGKSGGARVITFVKVTNESVFLISIFDKSEKENITNVEITEMLKGIK
jgi:hypothetical protein